MAQSGTCNPLQSAMKDSRDPSKKAVPGRVNFGAVNSAAMRALPDLLARWLPGGRFCGREYDVLNPRRGDRNVGNFRINVATGKWADFASDARGGDPVSLLAYLRGISQIEAARQLADLLRVPR